MKEIYKNIKNFENYQVSNLGNVRSVDRIVKGKNNTKRKIKGYIIKPFLNKGYLCVNLFKENKRYHKKIHRLVMETFYIEKNGLDVNHIDGNKENNNINNLEYCTRKENLIHAVKIGLNKQCIPIIGIKNGKIIISESIANFYRIIRKTENINCKEKTFKENVRRALNNKGTYYGYTFQIYSCNGGD